MDSIYFVKKDKDGNITGTGQWHPGDGINYLGHEQVSKEEWGRVNKEIVFPRQENLRRREEAKAYLEETNASIIKELETGEKCPQKVKDKRAAARRTIEEPLDGSKRNVQ